MNKPYEVEDIPGIERGAFGRLEMRGSWPNAKSLTPSEFVAAIAAGGHSMTPFWLYTGTRWTQAFLHREVGYGYAVLYPEACFRFAICAHEKVLRPGDAPNHSRGWHPGVCAKCGRDLTVDSSD